MLTRSLQKIVMGVALGAVSCGGESGTPSPLETGGHTGAQPTSTSSKPSKTAAGGAGATEATEAAGGAETATTKTTGKSNTNAGGASTGGSRATGGSTTAATGGSKATTSTSTGSGTDTDPCSVKTMPTGGQVHSATWQQGGAGNLAWQIWSNGTPGSITTFDNTPAFSASWNGSNYLGRLGYEWGNNPKSYKEYGTITIDFNSIKTGNSGGQWSYVGVYGWTNNPCIEWYIIEDSFSPMPFNLGGDCAALSNSPLSLDGGEYIICKRNTTGTGGDRCGGAGNWNQYYSIRKTARTCGTISVTKHFDAWTATAGNELGKLLEVKILVETGGGSGKVDFPLAKVTATSP